MPRQAALVRPQAVPLWDWVAITGLAHTYQGRLQQIAWHEVVGVLRDDDGDLVVFAQNGEAIPVGPTLYKHGQRLVDAVFTHVAGHLMYEAPAESDIKGKEASNFI